jgi:putative transposase
VPWLELPATDYILVGDLRGGCDGQMALRWCAAGMVKAGKRFRRVNGHLHLPTLRAAMERETGQSVGLVVHNVEVSAA